MAELLGDVIGVGDPGAVMASESLAWLSAGIVRPSEHEVRPLRILLITLLPATAGELMSLASSMRRL